MYDDAADLYTMISCFHFKDGRTSKHLLNIYNPRFEALKSVPETAVDGVIHVDKGTKQLRQMEHALFKRPIMSEMSSNR